MRPCVAPTIAESAIKSQPFDFINEIDGLHYPCALILDWVDSGSRDRRISIIAIASDALYADTHPAKKGNKGKIVPYGED